MQRRLPRVASGFSQHWKRQYSVVYDGPLPDRTVATDERRNPFLAPDATRVEMHAAKRCSVARTIWAMHKSCPCVHTCVCPRNLYSFPQRRLKAMQPAANDCAGASSPPPTHLVGNTLHSARSRKLQSGLLLRTKLPVAAHKPTRPRAFVLRLAPKECRNDGFVSSASCRRTAAVGTCHARSMTCCKPLPASGFPRRPSSTQTMNWARTRRCRRCRLQGNARTSSVLISSRSRVTPRPASPAPVRRLIASPSSARVETRSRRCSGTTATRPQFGVFARVHSSASEMPKSWQPSAAFSKCDSNGSKAPGAGWSAKPNNFAERARRRMLKDRRRLHVNSNSPAPTRIRIDSSDSWCPTRDMHLTTCST